MAFGDISGLTYPTRDGMPNSQVIDYMPTADAWAQDWQSRYDAEAAKARDPITAKQVMPNASGYTPNNWRAAGLSENPYQTQDIGVTWNGAVPTLDWSNTTGFTPLQQQQFSDRITRDASYQGMNDIYLSRPNLGPENEALFRDSLSPKLQSALYDWKLNPAGGAGQTVGQNIKGYTPDFSALDAEKARMLPMMEGQKRAQQGYDMMRGWGQENGVRSAAYSEPNFGQINGYFGQDKLGADPTAGIDMGWTGSASTTFGANSPAAGSNSTIWGAAPIRRSWGM